MESITLKIINEAGAKHANLREITTKAHGEYQIFETSKKLYIFLIIDFLDALVGQKVSQTMEMYELRLEKI